jgi:aminopeptidase N
MSDSKPQPKYLKDYRPSEYLIDTLDLRFELGEENTRVTAKSTFRRNPDGKPSGSPLLLHGRELELLSLKLDGTEIPLDEIDFDDEGMRLAGLPDAFELEVVTRIKPSENTSLEGLYKSGGNYCTQCEAEGFRKITYFLDRPDVMVRYTVRIEAGREHFPVLLSNGNLIEEGDLGEGRHFAVWEDPYPKPSYLFALVAGDLKAHEDHFTTRSGRKVVLRIWVRENDLDRVEHAMRSLIKSMKWDEDTFDLEYDLDIFNIVAVSDFNMGAMENKSLNIFNSKYVLARPETATDGDFVNVEAVIAHEYFHNWTGNRVTLNSWFQLSLKEGLTVLRDQLFTADMNSAAVERIESVRILRAGQFPEDAGPMSHPVRPQSYIEMNNFYTATVYEKGAEVIRMMRTLIGPKAFRAGMDLYFKRHDGKAVATDDFVAAMEDASAADLGQFRLWYEQAGTPDLRVSRSFESATGVYSLTFTQNIPDTPGQTDKKPMHIPVLMALLDKEGREIPLQLEGEDKPIGPQRVLSVREARQTFRFVNIAEAPTPSLLRQFSAPVRLNTDLSHTELSFLIKHDSDSFNRWEAGQQLATDLLLALVEDHQEGRTLEMDPVIVNAYREILSDEKLDPALVAHTLSLPGEGYLAELMDVVDPVAINEARQFLRSALGEALRSEFEMAYEQNHKDLPYDIDPVSMGRRALANLALAYLMSREDEASRAMAWEQFESANNMTDALGALGIFSGHQVPERAKALAAFYEKWKDDELVMDKWFSIQSWSSLPGTLDEVKKLMEHPAFDSLNPNKVRALISAFAFGNPLRFHAEGGEGYRFIADQIITLGKSNPQVAARLAGSFNRWTKFDAARQALMKAELQRILAEPDISANVFEIVSKALDVAPGKTMA